MIPRRYLARLPVSRQNARLRLAAHADGGPAELFPIGERQTRPNHPEQSSRFSAACAVKAYGGGAFDGAGLTDRELAVFVADPSANVVHRAVVDADGAAAEAGRGRPGVEFLASPDPLFRPVNLRVGPDGRGHWNRRRRVASTLAASAAIERRSSGRGGLAHELRSGRRRGRGRDRAPRLRRIAGRGLGPGAGGAAGSSGSLRSSPALAR